MPIAKHLLLAKRPRNLIIKRLDQIRDDVPIACLDEDLDRHAWNQLHRSKPRKLLGLNGDIDGIVAMPGAGIGRDVSGNTTDSAIDLWRGALIEGREAKPRHLLQLNLVDVSEGDLRFDH